MPGTFQQLRHSPGDGFLGIGAFAASSLFLLTDGTVLCQAELFKNWKRLVPDETGSYLNGTWVDVPDMHDDRLYYASAVLADGRLVVAGGEYRAGIAGVPVAAAVNAAEIFDPTTNAWTRIAMPGNLGPLSDAPATVLADGRWLVGATTTTATAIFDPATLSWTAAGTGGVKNGICDEETWVLLADGSVLTVETFASPQAERYLPATDAWMSAGMTPLDLIDEPSKEIGPAVLMADGRVFWVGGSGATALYTPPTSASDPGTWSPGPNIIIPGDPRRFQALDAPGCLLPNGHVLFLAGHAEGGTSPAAGDPTFFEFDGTTITSLGISPFNAALNYTYRYRMLLLPTGQVLIAWAHPDLWLFTPDGPPLAAVRPVITDAPSAVRVGDTFILGGVRLNGVSQAVSYGDDYQAATNYPIVRLEQTTNAGSRVEYARTFGHSSMGVATGDRPQSTHVEIPASTPPGTYQLHVVANGIASDGVPIAVTGTSWHHAALTGPADLGWSRTVHRLAGYAWDAGHAKQVALLTADGHVHELVVTAGAHWTHADLTALARGTPSAAPNSGLAAYAWDAVGSKQVVFLTPDGHVHELGVAPGGSWAHADLTAGTPGTPNASPSSELSGYSWNAGGSKQVVFLTADGHVHELVVTPGGRWAHADLTATTPGTPNAAPGSSISGYSWNTAGSKQVVFLTGDGHVHELVVTRGARWTHTDLTAAVPGAPSAAPGSPLIGYAWEAASSKQVVFLTADGHVHELYVSPRAAWGHADLTAVAAGAPTPVRGSPLCGYAWNAGGAKQVNFLTVDGHVHELSVRPGERWHHADLTAINPGTPTATVFPRLSGYSWEAAGSKQVVYLAGDGSVQELFV